MESISLIFAFYKQRMSRRVASAAAPAFTLVEMLVVLAIIGIITTIVLTGQSAFSRTLLLTDTAYTFALSLREAQTYGISSHIFSTTNNPNSGYGLYLTPNSQNYIEFADTYPASPGLLGASYCPGHTETNANLPDARPGNCQYDSGFDGLVRVYSFGEGYSIGSINAVSLGGTIISSGITAVDITYLRPNTTGVLVGIINGTPTALQRADIYIDSPQGATQCVVATQIGQISVEETCSP